LGSPRRRARPGFGRAVSEMGAGLIEEIATLLLFD